jgi:carbon storage regulator
MLVLSRKRGERVVIPGCSVTVTVVAVEGNRVRLGIAAPAEVAVLREELVRWKKERRRGRG